MPCVTAQSKCSDLMVGIVAYRFCFPCASKWAEIDNRCPACRESFTQITRKRLEPEGGHGDTDGEEGGGPAKKLRGNVLETCEVSERRQVCTAVHTCMQEGE